MPIQFSSQSSAIQAAQLSHFSTDFVAPFSPSLDERWNLQIHFLEPFLSVLKLQQKRFKSNPSSRFQKEANTEEVQTVCSKELLDFIIAQLSNGWELEAPRGLT